MLHEGSLQSATPDVSILIVNYNVKDYLLQCLRSITAIKGEERTEIIVVDNASSDNSVADLKPLFPHVKWIALEQNIGFGRGNNEGLKYCTGRYVLFLNPDTIVGQDTIHTMVEYLNANSNVGLAGCKVLNADGTFQLACRRGLPTPWASFCKLFGLQTLFPKSKLFARYNLTYKSVDETYDVDALIGAFMMGPLNIIQETGGFDPQFFMYGEDIDLCYRVKKMGHAVRYVHTTSIIHFKGESTKRSSMDEVQVFYDAMRIFARKHFGTSSMFIGLMAIGISVRSLYDRLKKRRREILSVVIDLICVNLALMAATAVRFEGPFGFPTYAYPTVFVTVSLVVLLTLLSVGEYVEYKPTIRRSFVALLAAFFVLSSLTYFFKEYAFSRGVVLMTIGFSALLFFVSRGLGALIDATVGSSSTRRILFVGLTENAVRILHSLQSADSRNTEVIGFVSSGLYHNTHFEGLPVLGAIDYLEKLIEHHEIQEVIVADSTIHQAQAMDLMMRSSSTHARFHLASEYDDIVLARIINDVSGIDPTVPLSPMLKFRNRTAKRGMDLVLAICIAPIAISGLFLGGSKQKGDWKNWVAVLSGSMSVVGLYPDNRRHIVGKQGITSLVHISQQNVLSKQAVENLNDYYIEHYSLSLDVEILLKHLLRRRG